MSHEAIYHEKQHLSLCALHSLNNLFQEQIFNKIMFDEICENLTPAKWFNPHRSCIGIGNYDVNVIMSALESCQYTMTWFDKRKNVNEIDFTKVFGFIINCRSNFKLGPLLLPSPQNHWFSIKKINGIFYNLDSKLSSPDVIGTQEECIQFLHNQVSQPEVSLFIICRESSIES